MHPVLIGYFPKITVRRPDWLKDAGVEEVCSASTCISKGPDDWIQAWKHNGHWLYDTPELAHQIAGPGEGGFEIFAFKQYPVRFDGGARIEEAVVAPNVRPLAEDFELLGFDAVSRSMGNAFECSPLSCNKGAETIPCNAKCLFETLDAALAGAEEFSRENWEPGSYYIVEVYRRKRDPAAQ